MKILGIHAGHDASASLVVNGAIVADAAEERFRRIKHYAGFPLRAIAYCLEEAARTSGDVDTIAVASSRVPDQWIHLLRGRLAEINDAARSTDGMSATSERARRLIGAAAPFPPLYVGPLSVRPGTPVVCVDHHLAHAASAYYTSGSNAKQLVVTLDGVGEGLSTCVWRGSDGRLEPLLKLDASASLGWFYGAVTEALGWWHGDGEGKTMALAAYGEADRCLDRMRELCPVFQDGVLSRPHDFGVPGYWPDGGAIHWHLRDAACIRELIARHGREHVAAAAQRELERQAIALIVPWADREDVDHLSCAGGVFLNVKLNQALRETGRFTRQHIYPCAGDAGLAAGAALHVHHSHVHAAPGSLEHVYLGPAYSDVTIEALLNVRRLPYRRVADPGGEAASLLADGKVVGWFQGAMESGPRALGHRSILMRADDARARDHLNERVKFRETFRPYCPSVAAEWRDAYLDDAWDDRYMITAFRAAAGRRDHVPGVVHVDGTVRAQVVHEDVNPEFWRLIDRLGDLTGEHLVVNTSFNLAGEPMVNTPSDAIRCFYDSGMDALVLGSFLLQK